MKTIPSLLINDLSRRGTNWCFAVKIKCKDGDVLGFTNLDTNLRLDDGDGLIVYSSREEMVPQNIQTESSFEVDNTNLLGWFDEDMEKLVLSGKFSAGEVTIYRVNYLAVSHGVEVVGFGSVGEIDFSPDTKGKRKIEFRSLMQQLKQIVIDSYSLLCRAKFGDDRCGMPYVWENATVSEVDDVNLKFTISGPAHADGYFDFGVVEFTDGDNAGAELEVESWTAAGGVTLSFVTPYPVRENDGLRIRRDCGKTFYDCKGYNNVINMRAEHLTPVENSSIMMPGAYIKSIGAQ